MYKKDNKMIIELEDGKYEVIFEELVDKFYATRYGQPWQDLTGNKLVYAMLERIVELERLVDNI